MTNKTATEVTLTVTVDGETKTFTASAETTGDTATTARGLISATSNDATNWTWEFSKVVRAARRLEREGATR
jgi:hypothetical protein